MIPLPQQSLKHFYVYFPIIYSSTFNTIVYIYFKEPLDQ